MVCTIFPLNFECVLGIGILDNLFIKCRGVKAYYLPLLFFYFLLFLDFRPGMAMESESEHTSCPEESSAHPRTKDSQETVAGRHLLSHKTPTLSANN